MSDTLKRLQTISHRLHKDKSEVATSFLSTLKESLAKRGYRADLALGTEARSTSGAFSAHVSFDSRLGIPSEKDLITLVAQAYPTHEIQWEMAEVDTENGVVAMHLEPGIEVLPISSLTEIPPEFKAMGTGLYKRAVDHTVNEIWTLKKGDDGLALYRNHDDVEIVAEENSLRAGDIANTPYGPAKIIRFDDQGNAIVLVGEKKRLIAAKDLGMYSIEKEKTKLKDYYSEAYGDAEFASGLVEDYTTRSKNTKTKKKK